LVGGIEVGILGFAFVRGGFAGFGGFDYGG
jgi:hypothetical protein